MAKWQYIRFFEEICIDDIPLVGGKNASLGEMYRELTPKALKSPMVSPSPLMPIGIF